MTFAALLAWCALTILWAPDKLLALQFVLRLALAGGLALLAYGLPAESPAGDSAEASKKWRKLAWAFLLGLVIPASLAIAQFFAQEAWPNKWLGLAEHLPYELGQSVIETADSSLGSARGGRWLRAYGSFDHPNILGAVMALGLMTALLLALSETRRRSRLAVLSIVPLCSFALFFSFSRSAWLALAAGLAYILYIQVRARRLKALKLTLYFLLVLGIQAFVLNDLAPDLVSTRLSGTARLERKSLIERGASYREAWAMVKNAPLAGHGAGSYVPALSASETGRPAYAYQPAHNAFLLIWAEIGLPGPALFLALLVFMYKKGSGKPILALLYMVFFMMLFDHWWWSLHFGLLFGAFILIIYKVNITNIK